MDGGIEAKLELYVNKLIKAEAAKHLYKISTPEAEPHPVARSSQNTEPETSLSRKRLVSTNEIPLMNRK